MRRTLFTILLVLATFEAGAASGSEFPDTTL
jgi:hypothetical protein